MAKTTSKAKAKKIEVNYLDPKVTDALRALVEMERNVEAHKQLIKDAKKATTAALAARRKAMVKVLGLSDTATDSGWNGGSTERRKILDALIKCHAAGDIYIKAFDDNIDVSDVPDSAEGTNE